MLLQLPEQREAAENEIRIHRLVDHENVIKLIGAEIKDQRNGEGMALLVFPYYQVSRSSHAHFWNWPWELTCYYPPFY